MTFVIATGGTINEADVYRVDRVQQLLDHVHDTLGEDATQAQIDDALCQLIVGELRTPKTVATVRRHFKQYWSLIAPLADREPEMFDSLILEMAEIIS